MFARQDGGYRLEACGTLGAPPPQMADRKQLSILPVASRTLPGPIHPKTLTLSHCQALINEERTET